MPTTKLLELHQTLVWEMGEFPLLIVGNGAGAIHIGDDDNGLVDGSGDKCRGYGYGYIAGHGIVNYGFGFDYGCGDGSGYGYGDGGICVLF